MRKKDAKSSRKNKSCLISLRNKRLTFYSFRSEAFGKMRHKKWRRRNLRRDLTLQLSQRVISTYDEVWLFIEFRIRFKLKMFSVIAIWSILCWEAMDDLSWDSQLSERRNSFQWRSDWRMLCLSISLLPLEFIPIAERLFNGINQFLH